MKDKQPCSERLSGKVSSRPKARTNVPETEVVALWQDNVRRCPCMTDSEGHPVQIVYPGRLNDSRGGDFRDAVVSLADECQKGCIEIHSLTSHWQAHGHHRDENYNQVVLHIALEQDRAVKTVRQNGLTVPTIILKGRTSAKPRKTRSAGCLPCGGTRQKSVPSRLLEFLESSGDARMAGKVARYQAESGTVESGQSLYQGVMEALGYSKNKRPFFELARRVPLSLMENLIRNAVSPESGLLRLEAILLGQAGFLPSQRPGFGQGTGSDYVDSLERIWTDFPAAHPLNFLDWELFKVRPGNHPVRRLAAAARLLLRFQSSGWLRSFLDLVRKSPDENAAAGLERSLTVTGEGYWAAHYDFGLSNSSVNPVLLGRERAGEILVNVLLPFAISWGRSVGEAGLEAKATALYRRYPRLETNSIERHMAAQLHLSPPAVNSARRQQGLLHIYKTLCTQGKCVECGLAEG